MAKPLILVGDFETTVYKGQDHTEVWASAIVPLFTEDVTIHHSIEETYTYLSELAKVQNIVIYYHNLKFDGSFWLDFLLVQKKLKQAYIRTGKEINQVEWLPKSKMKNNTFRYSVSAIGGQWYSIIIKVNNHFIEIRDSLKLLPFSVKRIGKAFKTKHQKLDMEYTGYRYAGCEITEEEKKYIANDVLVVKEALEIMFQQGHDKLTIGACCLEEFKDGYNRKIVTEFDPSSYEKKFPNLYAESMKLAYGENVEGIPTVGDYIRASYRGGWCYLVKGKEEREFYNGTTADVNSLYPSMMSSESGNYYPVGRPWFWKGNFCDEPFMIVPPIVKEQYWFVRLRTRFYLKPGMLPTIQLKHNSLYKGNEFLTTSDVLNPDGNYYSQYIGLDGEVKEAIVEMTMTQTDYQLMIEHYDLKDTEILDGAMFKAEIGLFDDYMAKYKKIKQESKGAMRELAKLFLNNLYGKMASSTDSSFKLAYVKHDGVVGFLPVIENNKKPGYIPIGSAITSYARNFTIRAAQKNYHGLDKPGFIYADTDSIHCDLPPDKIQGIKVHPTNFCCWKLESCWDVGTFTRQKTYIEHVVKEDLEDCKPYYNVKCAGMPQRCKDLFVMSLSGEITGGVNDEERKFVEQRRTLQDFHKGLVVPSSLKPKRIKGGILLIDQTYEMR